MQWVLNGEVDVTAHKGTLYIIDSECRPCVNRLDGKGTQPIGPDQTTDENASEDPRDLAADICAPARRGANRPPPVRVDLVDASGRNGGRNDGSNHVRKLPIFLRRELEKTVHARNMHALPIGLGKPASEPAS